MSKNNISVVVLSRNRPHSLYRCLKSIEKGIETPAKVVVYDNSDQDKYEVNKMNLKKLKLNIVHVRAKKEGIAKMRNKAIGYSRQKIIMGLDDDCRVDKRAVENVRKVFAKDMCLGILGAKIINIGFEGKDKYKGRGKLGSNGSYVKCENQTEATLFGSATISMRRFVWEKVGGYDEFFETAMEEADLVTRVRRAGYEVQYKPEVIVRHYNERGNSGLTASIGEKNRFRMYFFLKNYWPESVYEWITFLKNELILLGQDLNAGGSVTPKRQGASKALVSKHKSWVERDWRAAIYNWGFRPLLLIMTRVQLPIVAYYAHKARLGMIMKTKRV